MKKRKAVKTSKHKGLHRLLAEVNGNAKTIAALSDNQLKAKTQFFKKQFQAGVSLDELLPEAFAVIREADKRVLGMFPFDVQVLGGIVLHQGNVAEMKTGEGKTLTATMPLYLNALSGDSTILVTTNDYLAQRDATDMGKVYRWLGLSVACGVTDQAIELKAADKQKIYSADIVYTTNSALGFDYLLDNLADKIADKYMPPFGYVIVDEADAVLLDSAQTPLVISGAPRVQSNMYQLADNFILTLAQGNGYCLDEEREHVWLTAAGINEAERYFSLTNLYDGKHTELVRHIELALRAHALFENGKKYVVAADQVKLLDEQNGRILEMTKLQAGQHQALEAKERVKVTPDMRAMASITYQNLFRMFKKIGGMTGTGKSAEDEFIETYYMKVVQIPTNMPVLRKDLPDNIYTTLPEKLLASMKLVKRLYRKGQPVLLVTASVEISEIYSELLLRERIPHNVLNARNAVKEAQIIAEAGQKKRVTIATAMAGRGTDIKLGKGVKELGGLAVIGTEKMANERSELQLRGRSGRQGDPGFSQFFVSLEDEVVIKYGARWLHSYYEKHKERYVKPHLLSSWRIRRGVRRAQRVSDSNGYQQRKNTLEFDESVRVQRNVIYNQRNEFIYQADEFKYDVNALINKYIEKFIRDNEKLNVTKVSRFIFDNLSYRYSGVPAQFNLDDADTVRDLLQGIAQKELQVKKEQLNTPQEIFNFYRLSLLKAIDNCWIEEVDNLQQLRAVVFGRQYAQRNPLFEYHREAARSFRQMKEDLQTQAVKNLLLSSIVKEENGNLSVYFS
ncbi:accessory Sec system translocase SecA2 [Liquorilactobacillus satsumensis]|nr:accessory Sec system translocase SecA2 [Liquorilactobacillus satsumensis]MCP9358457.1 accessory Sec system translocase SecA2 [Liquorilactobacillus satsumensis]MCP9372411.1 accessory Sec system translocase SecA2 [Liquorilactobacillus satsumensis]